MNTHIPVDFSQVVSGVTIIGIVWLAGFLRKIDVRLTRIETILKVKNHLKDL